MDVSTQGETARSEPRQLEQLLETAFSAHVSQGVRCSLLGLCVDRLDHLADAAERERAQDALGRWLRERPESGAWQVARTQSTWWVLVPGSEPKQGLALARALVLAGRELTLDSPGKVKRLSISCGLADSSHATRPTLATCAAVVTEGLRVAAASGGRRAVHSEVYSAFAAAPARPGSPAHGAAHAQTAAPQAVSGAAHRPALLRQVELPRAPAAAVTSSPAAPAHPTSPSVDPNGHLAAHAPEKAALAPETAALAHEKGGASGDAADDEVMTRRLQKLVTELEKAEGEIARLRAQVASEGEGLASIYREVQGLSEDAAGGDLKRKMMARLFEANLALRALAATGERAKLPA